MVQMPPDLQAIACSHNEMIVDTQNSWQMTYDKEGETSAKLHAVRDAYRAYYKGYMDTSAFFVISFQAMYDWVFTQRTERVRYNLAYLAVMMNLFE